MESNISQTTDSRLVKKIESLVKEGVKNVPEMRKHLTGYMKSEIFGDSNVTDRTNKRFFPRPKTIRSHMVHTILKLRHSKIDQEYLIKKIAEWGKDITTPSIHFRAKSK